MKQIEAIVRPERLEHVTRALADLGLGGLTVGQVKGHGSQAGVRQMWRRKQYIVDLLPKVRIVAVVADRLVDTVVRTIVAAARTGFMGDGKIFVSPAEEAVRIRTGETGLAALGGGNELRQQHLFEPRVDAEAS